MKKQGLRVVAIDPCDRGFGFAAFEGRDLLLDWGIAYLSDRSESNIRTYLEDVITRNHPDAVVIQEARPGKPAKGKIQTKAAQLVALLENLADERSLPIRRITRADIRKAFVRSRNKNLIAETLAALHPELLPLPRARKLWTNEAERMHIFDAASLAFTALSK